MKEAKASMVCLIYPKNEQIDAKLTEYNVISLQKEEVAGLSSSFLKNIFFRIKKFIIMAPRTTKSLATTKKSNGDEAVVGSSHYTRPGVEAAVRLRRMMTMYTKTTITNSTDNSTTAVDGDGDVVVVEQIWERILERYEDMLQIKGGTKLCELDKECERIGELLRNNKKNNNNNNNYQFNKKDLMTIVQWKFTKGKPRYPLLKLIESNSESLIQQCTDKTLSYADKNEIKQAIDTFSQLKGVGPATASALLSVYKPTLFSFMDDEVIEALYTKGKRGYTTPIYLFMNEQCIHIAKSLNNTQQKKDRTNPNEPLLWDTRRVGKALWTATKLASTKNEIDFTLPENYNVGSTFSGSDKKKSSPDDNNRTSTVEKETVKLVESKKEESSGTVVEKETMKLVSKRKTAKEESQQQQEEDPKNEIQQKNPVPVDSTSSRASRAAKRSRKAE